MGNSTFKETTINDYLPQLYEAFPDIPKEDIKTIVRYGWRMLYKAHMAGCDTLVSSQDNRFWFYIGFLQRDSLKHINYYRKQLVRKIKYLFNTSKKDTSSIYYIGLNQEEYDQFCKDTSKRGKKKQKFTFNKKVSFKSKDACFVDGFNTVCILEYDNLIYRGFSFYNETLTVLNPKIVKLNKTKTFKDILVNNNDYDLL